jgi:hypothetical protein
MRGITLERDGDEWVLRLGGLDHADADAIGDLLAAVERSRSGGAARMLAAFARRRRQRIELGIAGATKLEVSEAAPGSSRQPDWKVTIEA